MEQPIILTGFQALNKLLGRPVYSSQLQLGGPRVMAANGVTHHVVADDLEGVKAILRWLSFVPPLLGALPAELPLIASADPWDRDVAYPAAGERSKPCRPASPRTLSPTSPRARATSARRARSDQSCSLESLTPAPSLRRGPQVQLPRGHRGRGARWTLAGRPLRPWLVD